MTSSRPTTYLDRILAAHRATAAADDRPIDALLQAARQVVEPARHFAAALAASEGLAVIAEVKRRSPSKGALRQDLDPADLASVYAAGGAACLSVLTDAEFFGGSAGDLQAAREASRLPTLRKDFTVAPADVCDARLMGADAVLLIAAALNDDELRELHALVVDLGMDALVEVHDEAELERALAVGATLVGVNQRDLVTFEVDTSRAERMAAAMPAGVVAVAESGVRHGGDARRLADAGYQAVLVGESLVTSDDPATALRALRVPQRPPPHSVLRSGRRPYPVPSFKEEPGHGQGTAFRALPVLRRTPAWILGRTAVPRSIKGVFVKICGITSEEDALLAVAMGADAVGFIFAPSVRQIAPSIARDISKRLPPEILTVGVFRDETAQRAVSIVNTAGLRAAQLQGHESPETTRWVRERVPFVIRAFAAGDPGLDRADEYGADAIHIDSPRPGSGEVFDWSLAEGAPAGRRVIMAGGLTADNVGDAIHRVLPWGVDVATGVEVDHGQPGKKDARKVKAFIEAARAAAPPGHHSDLAAPYDWMEDPSS